VRRGSEHLVDFLDQGDQGLVQRFRRPDGSLSPDIPTEHLEYWDTAANGRMGGWKDFPPAREYRATPQGSAGSSGTVANGPDASGRYHIDLDEFTVPPSAKAPADTKTPQTPATASEAASDRTGATIEPPRLAERTPAEAPPPVRQLEAGPAPEPSIRSETVTHRLGSVTEPPPAPAGRAPAVETPPIQQPEAGASPKPSSRDETATNRMGPSTEPPQVASRTPAVGDPAVRDPAVQGARSTVEPVEGQTGLQASLDPRLLPVDPNDPFSASVLPAGRAPFESNAAGFYDTSTNRLIYKDAPVLGRELGTGTNATVFAHSKESIVKIRRLEDKFSHAEDAAVGRALLEQGERPDGYYRTAKLKSEPVVVRDRDGNRYLVTVEENMSKVEGGVIMTSAADRFASRPPNADELATIHLALRELNRRGLVWLDNKLANFDIIPEASSPTKYRMVIIDTGGIVPVEVVGGSAKRRWQLARELQRDFDQVRDVRDWEYVTWRVANDMDTRPFGPAYTDSIFAMGAPAKAIPGYLKFRSADYPLLNRADADQLEGILEAQLGRKIPLPPSPGTPGFKPRRRRYGEIRRRSVRCRSIAVRRSSIA
jgi:hypothetical protein